MERSERKKVGSDLSTAFAQLFITGMLLGPASQPPVPHLSTPSASWFQPRGVQPTSALQFSSSWEPRNSWRGPRCPPMASQRTGLGPAPWGWQREPLALGAFPLDSEGKAAERREEGLRIPHWVRVTLPRPCLLFRKGKPTRLAAWTPYLGGRGVGGSYLLSCELHHHPISASQIAQQTHLMGPLMWCNNHQYNILTKIV